MGELLGDLQDRTFARATAATAISYPPERRLSASELASYLDRRKFAVVGSTRGDGRPPWLTMVIAEADHPHHIAVIAEGPAKVVASPEVPADVRAAVAGDWVSAWICVTTERLLSYA